MKLRLLCHVHNCIQSVSQVGEKDRSWCYKHLNEWMNEYQSTFVISKNTDYCRGWMWSCTGVLTELGLECLRSLGDSLPADELLALMQALFSEWTLFTWLAGFSNGSKPLCVRWTLTFLSSGMVSRGLMTESVPWQLRVDIFVTHICGGRRQQKEEKKGKENTKVSIKERNPSAITSVQPKTDCALIFQILPVFHLPVSLGLFPPCRAVLLPLC